jgi:hypothetical protein
MARFLKAPLDRVIEALIALLIRAFGRLAEIAPQRRPAPPSSQESRRPDPR